MQTHYKFRSGFVRVDLGWPWDYVILGCTLDSRRPDIDYCIAYVHSLILELHACITFSTLNILPVSDARGLLIAGCADEVFRITSIPTAISPGACVTGEAVDCGCPYQIILLRPRGDNFDATVAKSK